MTRTENLQLPVWEAADRIMMADFNDMTEKLDAAVGANTAAAAEHTAELAKRGNCQLYVTSYTSQSAPVTITFPEQPLLVVIYHKNASTATVLPYGTASIYTHNQLTSGMQWTETTLTIPNGAENSLNGVGAAVRSQPYLVYALIPLD